jgi:hypothetical protein
MTDLSTPIAQTNLQLYRQLQEAGYSAQDQQQVHAAYLRAALRSAGMLRGSGKAFVAHLAGTASLCAIEGAPAHVLIAAILHTYYRFHSSSDINIAQSAFACERQDIQTEFGTAAERLSFAYFIANHVDSALRKAHPMALSEDEARWLYLLELADNIEDALDYGMCVHGKADDSDAHRGSAAWRIARMQQEQARRVADAHRYGFTTLADLYRALLVQSLQAQPGQALFSGYYGSFRVE